MANQLCLGCAAVGRVEVSEVTDHILPHRGDPNLFWDSANWQPLCDWHHNTVKQKLEAAYDRGALCADDLRIGSVAAVAATRRAEHDRWG